MLKPTYYGEYKSSTSSTSGCLKKFMTVGSENIIYPPQLNYTCDLCGTKTHGFGLVRVWSVATKRQLEGFTSYCAFNSIETDIDII